MERSGTDVLIFVEDPGAANYVADLPASLLRRGWRSTVLTAGTATAFLTSRGIPVVPAVAGVAAGEVLNAYRPRVLLVGTSENEDTLGLHLIDAARQADLPSVGAVDAEANAEHRFRGRSDRPLAHVPDWLLVPDPSTRDRYVDLGYPVEQVRVCGHPHHDHIRAEGDRLANQSRAELRRAVYPGAAEDQTVIVFVAEISTGLDPDQYRRSNEYTLEGRGGSVGRTEVVLEEFLDAASALNPRPYLVLRLHPKQEEADLLGYRSEFHQISRAEPALRVVYAADLVVGMTSMLLFEAALLGCLTLSIVPRVAERAWLPSIRRGLTPCVTTRQELRVTLTRMAEGTALQGGRRLVDEGVFGATERVTDWLSGLLEGKGTLHREAGRGPCTRS